MGNQKMNSTDHHSQDQDSHEDHDFESHAGSHKKEEGEGPRLVSYADLMTLLMGFFALISSMSVIDKDRLEKVKESASKQFGGEYEKPYEGLSESLAQFIKEKDLQDVVSINRTSQGVDVTFTGSLFFESGDFILKDQGRQLMSELAVVIKNENRKYKILVEGHTDSVPIRHSIVSSNWELSGIRASRVAQVFENSGFNKKQLTIIGWGETRPAVPERGPSGDLLSESMSKNRRVVVRVYDPNISEDPIKPALKQTPEKTY